MSTIRRRRTRGMAMVEMVFVLPVLLMILFGIAQLGLMFNRWLTLSNAVREGARAGVTWDDSCDPGETTTRIKQTVLAYADAGQIKDLPAEKITLTGVCGGRGSDLKVTADYDFTLRIPFADLGDFGTVDLDYTAAMVNE